MDNKHNQSAGYTYAQAGVDIAAGNALVRAIAPLAKSTRRPGAAADLGGFGGFFDLRAAGFKDPLLVAANDGVGTKLKLAIDSGKHDTVGIDLVAMCANDLIVQGAEPLFFLDYFATGKLDNGVAERVIAGIAEGCLQAGCALIGGETAEMPGMYADGDYDLAGFCVGAVERDEVLTADKVADGDVILGLASSGVHSNGYSLVRRLAADKGWKLDRPALFDNEVLLIDALMAPTRIYVKPLLPLVRAGKVHAMAHITGGGEAAGCGVRRRVERDGGVGSDARRLSMSRAKPVSIEQVSVVQVAEIGSIPIAFMVERVCDVIRTEAKTLDLRERPVATPYLKDYDGIDGNRPAQWAEMFDLVNWALFIARDGAEAIGSTLIAFDTAGVDMLEGRRDLAIIWDLRLGPERRGQGIGRQLIKAGEDWARRQGCREIRVETQTINAPACHAYAAAGFRLLSATPDAYPDCPDETQLIWTKALEQDL